MPKKVVTSAPVLGDWEAILFQTDFNQTLMILMGGFSLGFGGRMLLNGDPKDRDSFRKSVCASLVVGVSVGAFVLGLTIFPKRYVGMILPGVAYLMGDPGSTAASLVAPAKSMRR